MERNSTAWNAAMEPTTLWTMTTSGVVGAVMILLFHVWRKGSSSRSSSSSKETPPLPPYGLDFMVYIEAVMGNRSADQQEAWVKKYGRIFTLRTPWLLQWLVPTQVVVADAGLTKELCITQANQYRPPSRFTTRKPEFAAATVQSVGRSLASSMGDEWKWRRVAFLKEMHKSKLLSAERGLLDCVVRVGENFCGRLQQAADSAKPVQVDTLATEAAIDTILFFLFGKVLEGYDAAECRQAAKDTLSYLFGVLTLGGFAFWKHVPGTRAHELLVTRNKAWAVFDRLVLAEVQLMLREARGEVPKSPDRAPGSILECWFQSEPQFYSRGMGPIIAEVRGMILAGFETTAHALAYSMGIMAQHADLADKLHQVATQALDRMKKEETSTSSSHKKSHPMEVAMEHSDYVKNFFMEAIRLYPLAPSLNGLCTDDVLVDYKDPSSGEIHRYSLPKGTDITFLNFAMQRQDDACRSLPEFKPGHEVDPLRWNAKDEAPFLHVFNTGAHTCPGKPLSILEGHVFLLQIAAQFQFHFPPGIDKVEYTEELLLRPKNAMPLLVTKRRPAA